MPRVANHLLLDTWSRVRLIRHLTFSKGTSWSLEERKRAVSPKLPGDAAFLFPPPLLDLEGVTTNRVYTDSYVLAMLPATV
jgi:hypothetical protein